MTSTHGKFVYYNNLSEYLFINNYLFSTLGTLDNCYLFLTPYKQQSWWFTDMNDKTDAQCSLRRKQCYRDLVVYTNNAQDFVRAVHDGFKHASIINRLIILNMMVKVFHYEKFKTVRVL